MATDDVVPGGGKADAPSCGDGEWKRSAIAHVREVFQAPYFGVSATGAPRVIYMDAQNGVTAMSRSATGEWTSQHLAGHGYNDAASMIVERSGAAHVCFLRDHAIECRDAKKGKPWDDAVTLQPPIPQPSEFLAIGSLARGPDGSLALGVTTTHWRWERPGSDVRQSTHYMAQVAYRAADRETFQFGEPIIDTTNYHDVGGRPLVALDRDERQHAFVPNSSQLGYFQRADLGLWTEHRPSYVAAYANELLAAPDGTLWMVADEPNGIVVRSMNPDDDDEWTAEALGISTPTSGSRFVSPETQIAIDSRGRIHVVAVGSDRSPIHAVRLGDNNWIRERIDTQNVEAVAPRIGIDQDDNLSVVYWDRTLGNLVYAQRACTH